jgi:cytochrome c oxidase subunit 2
MPAKPGLGPGFWPVTIGLTVLNVIVSYAIVVFPIEAFVPEMGEPAADIDLLFKFMSIVGNAIFFYVAGYLVYFSIVWRRRATDPPDAIGIQIHDNGKLEMWWTIIPAILVVIIAVFSVRIWMNLQNTLGDVLTMEAIGHQFKYEFRYPRLKQSVYDEMHLPVGTPVTLHVTAADVIHSFWVPEMRIKADMVPGLVQTLRFTPENIGKYRIICTEFCGTNHGNMLATLYVDTQQDFGRWLARQNKLQGQAGGPIVLSSGQVAAGQALFGQKCSSCHSVGPFTQKIVGPGLGALADDPDHPNLVTGKTPNAANVAWVLVNGYQGPDNSQGKNGPSIGVMPNRQANALSNQDIANLTAYVISLSQKK